MRRRCGIVLLCLLLLGGCVRTAEQTTTTEPFAPAQTEQPSFAPAETTSETKIETTTAPQPLDGDTAQALDTILRRYGASGAQAAVIRDGRVAFLYTFGYADAARQTAVADDTKFRCASLSKIVCAMVIAALQTQGRLDFDADAGDLLGYTVRNPRYPDVQITLRMLMTHTSSITDSADFITSRNAVSATPLRTLLTKRSSYTSAAPGRQYVYSNFGVAVLAAAAERLTGMSFESLSQQFLFRPLGIDASFSASTLRQPELTGVLFGTSGAVQWSVPRQMEERPLSQLAQTHHIYQGNLTISAGDYARLLCLLMQGNGEASEAYPAAAAEAILSPQFTGASVTQGLCVRRTDRLVTGRSLWVHSGYNFGMFAAFALDSADNSGVVVLTSGANAALDDSSLPNVCSAVIRTLYGA